MKPSINLVLKNKENHKPIDVCKSEVRTLFEKILAKKKKNSEMNNDIVIHNANYPKQTNKMNMAVPILLKLKFFLYVFIKPSNHHMTTTFDYKNSNSSLNTTHTTSEEKQEIEKIGPNSFIILGLIGKGSVGEVYLVEKKNTKTLNAMKVLHKSKIMSKN